MAKSLYVGSRSFLQARCKLPSITTVSTYFLSLPFTEYFPAGFCKLNPCARREWQHKCCVGGEAFRNATIATDSSYGGKQVIRVDQPLYDYMLAHTREPQVLCELREETSSIIGSQMQVSPDQGQFLAMLVRLIGAKRCIEVGVYTGYSSLAVALALPDCGRLVACDRDKNHLNVAQRYYERAGISHKVDIRHGTALDTLTDLVNGGEANSYDFSFLDADKRNYGKYYELLLQLTRAGGLLVIDNVLWHGKVADAQENDKRTQSIRNFNKFILHDVRVDISTVPIGDGMTLCRKRQTD